MDTSSAQALCEEVVECDDSIRAAAVANNVGNMVALYYRRGLVPFLGREESERYSVAAAIRAMTHEMFANKIGNLRYAVAIYEKIAQVTIPVRQDANNKLFLLIGFNLDSDYLGITEKKVMQIVDKNKANIL